MEKHVAKSDVPTRRSSRTVYRGRVITVLQDTIDAPDGRTIRMDVVRHRGSVVLVPQPTETDVILIRQYRYVIGRWIWELPAGSLDEGESPARGARRECAEEVGWHPRTLVRLGVYYPTPGFCDEKLTFYACRDLVRPTRTVHLDPDEQIEVQVVALKSAWRMVERGEIIDLKTVAGLGMALGRIPTRER
jgi:ADP-ribose pyrophosphatase